MVYVVGIILFGCLAILQSTIVSRMPLLNGTADLILLFILAWVLQEKVKTGWQWCVIGGIFASLYSGLPFGTFIVAYLLTAGIARLLKQRVWKAPYLAMLTATFIGTIVVQFVSYASRLIMGVNIPVISAINLILLPSLVLNLLLAIPIYAIMHDLAGWVYPEELEA